MDNEVIGVRVKNGFFTSNSRSIQTLVFHTNLHFNWRFKKSRKGHTRNKLKLIDKYQVFIEPPTQMAYKLLCVSLIFLSCSMSIYIHRFTKTR